MIADDAVTAAKLANSINTEIAANTAKVTNATHTGDVTGATALTIAADAVTTAKIADDNVTADKLANSINTDIATGVTANTTANAALPKAGGEMTGNLTIPNNRIGVGISSPSVPIQIRSPLSSVGQTTPETVLMLETTAGSGDMQVGSGTRILFKISDDETNPSVGAAIDAVRADGDDSRSDTSLVFSVSQNDETLDEAMRIASTGAASFTNSVTTGTDTDTSNTGSVTLDFAANQNFVLTLTGNVTLANPSTEQVGQSGFITFIQDGTGSRTVALGTDYETAGGAGLTLTSTASATDIVPYVVVASGRILLGTPQLAFA